VRPVMGLGDRPVVAVVDMGSILKEP
jgi:hypothetical protein